VAESFKVFHSSIELVEPETSRINKLLSAAGSGMAWAEVGVRTLAINPVSTREARTEVLLRMRIWGTLKDLSQIG
jgi:hypothetical protein